MVEIFLRPIFTDLPESINRFGVKIHLVRKFRPKISTLHKLNSLTCFLVFSVQSMLASKRGLARNWAFQIFSEIYIYIYIYNISTTGFRKCTFATWGFYSVLCCFYLKRRNTSRYLTYGEFEFSVENLVRDEFSLEIY